LQEELAARLAEQTNSNLYIVSLFTALLLPPSLIAGIFGMNVVGGIYCALPYRYRVDPTRLEAERQRREFAQCQQAIAETRMDWSALSPILDDLQQPDWGDYYVRLRVKPEVGDLNLNVALVSEDRAAPSNEQARRDREMEETWCAAHQESLKHLAKRGIASESLRAHASGELPVQCVQPEAVQRPRRARLRQ